MKREVNFTEPGWFCRSTTFSLFVLFLSFGFALQVQADCLNEDGICYDSGSWKPPVAPSATVTTPPASGQTVAGNSYAGEFDGVDIQGPPETIQHTPEMDFGATNVDNSDFAGVGPDGGAATTSKCNSAYIQASNSCVNAAKTADTVGGAAIAGESSKAHNGSIQGGAQGLKTRARSPQAETKLLRPPANKLVSIVVACVVPPSPLTTIAHRWRPRLDELRLPHERPTWQRLPKKPRLNVMST